MDTQLSLVLVQHLDPSRPTQLTELLVPHCTLPVTTAADGTRLEPGHVYVVPEGQIARLEGGKIRLAERDESCRERLIDTFLSSLAAHGGHACGVILSGLGSDGVRGLEDIVASGGLAYVQEPSTAEYDSMPRAAARVADVVAPLEEIAAELAQRGRIEVADEADQKLGAVVTEILVLVSREIGIDFSQYKQTTVRRRVTRRALLLGLTDVGGYLGVLRGEPDEVRALADDLLIHVTEFFRDPEVFEALRSRVFPAILKQKKPGDTVRIWVPACSTGEEVYSVLITMLEAMDDIGEQLPITVFGTDASERAIRGARSGVYPAGSCGALSPDRLARFFEPVEGGYRVQRALREMCIFARQDVTRDTPFSRLDVVSLRNVLIYFQPTLQKRVLAIVHYALLPKGFLVLGTSETAETQSKLFSAYDKQRHIYRRREVSGHLPVELGSASRISLDALQPASLIEGTSTEFDVHAEADHLVLAAFAPPHVVVDADGQIIHFSGDTSPYLEHGQGRASLFVLDMARPSVVYELREAFEAAKTTHAPASREATLSSDGQQLRVSLQVLPIASPTELTYYLIAFEEIATVVSSSAGNEEIAHLYESREERLRREIHALRARIRTISEEKDLAYQNLRSANEEVSSSNEELRSINEELETAKEELQSANEELITVNDELLVRNRDLAELNEIVTNFVSSAQIPMIMVDRDLRVRRHTPQASRVVHILPSDDGRFLPYLRFRVDAPEIEQMVQRVIETAEPVDRDVRDEDGRWFSMRIQPYRLAEGEVDGAVLTFIDINDLKYNIRRVERRAQLSSALNDIEATLASTLTFDEIMQGALDEGVRALGADAGTIEVREGEVWAVRYQHGFRREDVGVRLSDVEAPIAVRTARTSEPQVIQDAAEDETLNVGFVREYGLRSVLASPLVLRGAVTGCLLFFSKQRPRPFTSSEIDFARRLAAATSLSLENARLLDEERRTARAAETLNTINEIVRSALTLDELVGRLVGEVSEVAGADKSLVIDVRGEDYTVTHVRNVRNDIVGVSKSADEYPGFALAARNRQPLMMGDTWTDPRTNKDFVIAYDLHAFQLLPLIVDDQVLAVLALAYDTPRTFDAEDERFAERLAAAMSLALRNVRLFEAERDARRVEAERAERIAALSQIAQESTSSLEIPEVASRVLTSVSRLLGANQAQLRMLSATGTELDSVATVDSSGYLATLGSLPIDADTETARCFRTSEPRIGEDITPSVSKPSKRNAAASAVRSYVIVPVLVGSDVIGTMYLAWAQPRHFEPENVSFIEAVAAQFALGLQNARLFEEVRRTSERLANVLDSMVDGFVSVGRTWRYTMVNPRAADMLGKPASDLLGRSMEDLYPDMSGWEHYRRVMAERVPETFEVWSKPLETWLEVHAYPTEDGLSILFADIRERKAAEESLVSTSERLRLLAESSRLLLTAETPEGVVQTIAEQVMRFLDCQVFFNYLVEDEGEGMHLNAYAGVPPESAAELEHLDLGAAVCGCVARDGSRIVVEDIQHTEDERANLVRSLGVQAYACHPLVYRGETIGTMSFGTRTRAAFNDDEIELMRIVADQAATAMARKRAEDRLRASRAEIDAERTLLRRIIDQMPIGVAIVDTRGTLLEINEANHRIWAGEDLPPVVSAEGYTAYKAFHRGSGTPFEPDDYPVVQTLRTGEQSSTTADIERFDDTDGTIRITSVPLRDIEGTMTGIVVLTEDITAEVEAQRLDQALAEISATISATLDYEEILHRLVESSAAALDVDTSGLTVKEGDSWVMREFLGMPKSHVTSALSDHQLELSLLASAQHEPLAINDVEQDPRVDSRRMRALGIRSLLAVPIVVQHAVVGVLLYHHRLATTAFKPEQLDFATKLMGIATLALENARLYERERRIADTLQEAVLTPPEAVPGIEFAHLYRPASESANVGGDFYDMFSIDERYIAIVVGDVSGKGIDAARLTSLLRDGIRAYAFEHLGPANVLQHVNDLVRRSSAIESFATGFLGVLDLITGEMRYCSAGHPPAATLTSAGVSFLPGPSSSIIGAFSQAVFNEQVTKLSPGDTLVLYTDGVTEARTGRELFGEDRLADTLRQLASAPLAEIPDRLVERVKEFGGGMLRDDTVIVCVRWLGPPTDA